MRKDERWAAQVVADVLSLEVVEHDDNRRPSMPDFLIKGERGDEPLEVVSDADSAYLQLLKALDRHGSTIPLPPDERSWDATLQHTADVRRVRAELPGLIAKHRDFLLNGVDVAEIEQLGVDCVELRDGHTGAIRLDGAGWNSWDDPNTFEQWLDGFFLKHTDVPSKLIAHGGPRLHAFIWLESLKAWNAIEMLELDEDDLGLPEHSPAVPVELTDIWIASTLARPTRGVLRWQRDAGWSWHPFTIGEGA